MESKEHNIEITRDGYGRPRVFLEGDDVPIKVLSIECQRERGASSALPPLYFLHVWWARRPLTVSRAAVLGSVLPESFDKVAFLELMGVPRGADPVADRERLDEANRREEKLKQGFTYSRAFTNKVPETAIGLMNTALSTAWKAEQMSVLDSFAGGGSIPFEASRFGFKAILNELNPVAVVVEKATMEYPALFGPSFGNEIEEWGNRIASEVQEKLSGCFPKQPGETIFAYIWVRTVTCPKCELSVPLAPNWWLDKGNDIGYRYVLPPSGEKVCSFEVVEVTEDFDPEKGTVKGGVGACPRCGEPLDRDEINRQALAREMGHQLAVVGYKKEGVKGRPFREVTEEDLVGVRQAEEMLKEKLPEWEARGLVPNDPIPQGSKTREPLNKGARVWADLFNPRQLLVHLTTLEAILAQPWDEIKDEKKREALRVYLQIALSKTLSHNSKQSRWDPGNMKICNLFERHDFAFKWSYGEIDGAGHLFRFGISQVVDAYRGIAKLLEGAEGAATFTCGDAADLASIQDGSIDCVVIDPPYYANVMYAELADFFYVWMKRGLGDVFPDLLATDLTEKEHETVANAARFKHLGRGKGASLAKNDYEAKMALAFRELHRVLRDDGVMTVMFTHKEVEAWDTLSKALMDTGFEITASWPIHTESEHSLHQAKKNAAQSTILLVCRKRPAEAGTGWWEELKPVLEETVLEKAVRFEEVGLNRLDLSIACFGPALEIISRKWPVKRGDGSLIKPDEALDAARQVVVQWFMDKISQGHRSDVDPRTQFYILAWYIFQARQFPYDEAHKLAIAVGVDMDDLVRAKVIEKKGKYVILVKPTDRFRDKGLKAGADSYKWDLDYVYAAMYAYEIGKGGELARFHDTTGAVERPGYLNAVRALLNILPQTKEVVEHELMRGMWEAGLQDVIEGSG